MQTSVGIDLGIRSGAVVQVGFTAEPIQIQVITTTWTGSRVRGKKARAGRPELDVTELAKIGQQQISSITSAYFQRTYCPVGIDWGLHEAYWGSRKPALQKAFLAGFIYRRLLEQGAMPLFISPTEVRRFIGLKANATKEAVQAAFLEYVDPNVRPQVLSLNEHEVDAALLAIISHRALQSTQEATSWMLPMHG